MHSFGGGAASSDIVRAAISILLGVLNLPGAAVDGRKVHYSVAGSGARAVLLIHGWACDETVWRNQVAALEPNFRVVTMDLPGHGRSEPAATPLGQYVFTQAVAAVLDEAKIPRAVLVGHGMGGFVARRFAQLNPKRVAALVAIDAPFQVPPATFAEMARQFQGPQGREAREQAIGYLFTGRSNPQLRRQLTGMMMQAPERTAVESYASMEDFGDGWEASVEVPTLALAAGSNVMGSADSLEKLFTDAEYYQFAGAGHFLMLERPEDVNRLLVEFLRRVRW
jgi:pimeloyl-ACP methyl ester carboxylesterase